MSAHSLTCLCVIVVNAVILCVGAMQEWAAPRKQPREQTSRLENVEREERENTHICRIEVGRRPMAAEEHEAISQWQRGPLCAAAPQAQVFSKVFAQVGLGSAKWQQRWRHWEVQGCRRTNFGKDCTTHTFHWRNIHNRTKGRAKGGGGSEF